MIRAVIDTNVILDFVKVREFHEEAGRILESAFAHSFKACVAAHQVTTIAYYMGRAAPSREDFRATVSEMLGHFDVFPVNRKHLDAAIRSAITDFEDAVLEETAAENGVDYIVTRNMKDFKKSRVTALSPAQFLKLLSTESEYPNLIRESAPSYRTRPRRRRAGSGKAKAT